jgi:hypothetical protein
MARSTFEGPILSGDNRFGALRNVGSVALAQSATLDLANVTANTAGYAGASGSFVDSNGIPNTVGVVYTPSASVFPPVAATIPADSATNIYRGFVAYLPAGSRINSFLVDIGVVSAVAAGTLTSTTIYISNNYTAAAGTPTYGATAVLTSPAVGRQALATFTATQLANQQATSSDITNSGQPSRLSQVVFTVALVGTSMTTPSAGTFYFTVEYTQADGNIGSTTAYPYGNFD